MKEKFLNYSIYAKNKRIEDKPDNIYVNNERFKIQKQLKKGNNGDKNSGTHSHPDHHLTPQFRSTSRLPLTQNLPL